MSRTVTGTFKHLDGTAASGTVKFELVNSVVVGSDIHLSETFNETLDGSGQFSITLVTPTTGTAKYRVTLPDETIYDIYLATGATVDLSTLITIPTVEEDQNELQTLFDTHVSANDPHDQYIKDESDTISVNTTTNKVYLGGTTNGLEISEGGALRAIGTATWFDDLRVEPTVRSTGTKAPTYTNYTPGGVASGIYFYLFDNAIANSEKEVNFKLQIPHGKLLGSVIHLHLHWVPTSTGSAGQKVRWGLEYTRANPGGTFGATTTIYATDPVSPPSSTPTVHTHYITEFADIDMTGDAISAILLCRLFRNSSDAADTFGGDVGLLYIDAHIEYSQLGSNQEYTQ